MKRLYKLLSLILTFCMFTTVDAGQRQMVMDIHGDDESEGGSSVDKERALALAANDNMDIGTLQIASETTFNQTNVDYMNSELASGRWVVGSTIYTNANSGHSIVIKNYNMGEYTYWDPWDDAEGTFSIEALKTNTITLIGETQFRRLRYIHFCS